MKSYRLQNEPTELFQKCLIGCFIIIHFFRDSFSKILSNKSVFCPRWSFYQNSSISLKTFWNYSQLWNYEWLFIFSPLLLFCAFRFSPYLANDSDILLFGHHLTIESEGKLNEDFNCPTVNLCESNFICGLKFLSVDAQ